MYGFLRNGFSPGSIPGAEQKPWHSVNDEARLTVRKDGHFKSTK